MDTYEEWCQRGMLSAGQQDSWVAVRSPTARQLEMPTVHVRGYRCNIFARLIVRDGGDRIVKLEQSTLAAVIGCSALAAGDDSALRIPSANCKVRSNKARCVPSAVAESFIGHLRI